MWKLISPKTFHLHSPSANSPTRKSHARPQTLHKYPLHNISIHHSSNNTHTQPISSHTHSITSYSMAAKFSLAASLLVALIALAAATTYTTTIVTTSAEDESNQQQFRQCQQQLQGRPFRSCQRYLSQRSPFNGEEEDVASLEEDNDEEANQQQGALMECCRELRNVNPPCQCAAIRQAVRQLQRERGIYGQMGQMQTVSMKARNLPQRCGLPVRQCQIRAIFV